MCKKSLPTIHWLRCFKKTSLYSSMRPKIYGSHWLNSWGPSPGGGRTPWAGPNQWALLHPKLRQKGPFFATDKTLATSCCRRVPEKPHFKKKWDKNLATSKKQRVLVLSIFWAANFTWIFGWKKELQSHGKKVKFLQTMPRCFFWKGVIHVTVTYQLSKQKKTHFNFH